MRIHSDSIEELEVRKAARLAGVGFTRLSLHGSRSRAAAFDVILTGNSGRRQNMGGPDEAATWDEWGIVLGHLHRLDPNLKTPYYHGEEHYVWATGGRFTPDFTPASQHIRHRWEFAGIGVTGSYSVFECAAGRNPCGAIMRSLRGEKWEEFTARNR
jgi:hypothetical protein